MPKPHKDLVVNTTMFILGVFFLCNVCCYPLLTYFFPFNHNDVFLSNMGLVSFIARLSDFRVFLYGDDFNPSEKSVIMSNHRSMYDIATMFQVSSHFNRVIGFCLKKQVAYIPGIGWWCTRMKFPTLNRNIADLKTLKCDTTPFPLVIYPEGTRFTEEKYQESLQFAKKNDYPISKYAQLPKYKGTFALSGEIAYHITLIYLDKHKRIIAGKIRGFPHDVYVHVKKHTNVPRDEAEYKKWIQNQFLATDDIYDNFNPTNAIEMTPKFEPIHCLFYAMYIGLHIIFARWLLGF